MNDIQNQYFDYICSKVITNTEKRKYSKLLKRLFHVDFNYILPMDGNRAEDGISLRYHFGEDLGYLAPDICYHLDNRPCSILEMLVALAERLENSIMYNSDYGDRTDVWFKIMIDNLGLAEMDNTNYDEYYVNDVLDRFVNRKYNKNGSNGNIFIFSKKDDIRNTEIWYQAHFYLEHYL